MVVSHVWEAEVSAFSTPSGLPVKKCNNELNYLFILEYDTIIQNWRAVQIHQLVCYTSNCSCECVLCLEDYYLLKHNAGSFNRYQRFKENSTSICQGFHLDDGSSRYFYSVTFYKSNLKQSQQRKPHISCLLC